MTDFNNPEPTTPLTTDQKIDKLLAIVATKTDITDVKNDARETERRLMKHAEDLQHELARMVADGFADVQHRLDATDRIERVELAVKKLATQTGLKLEW